MDPLPGADDRPGTREREEAERDPARKHAAEEYERAMAWKPRRGDLVAMMQTPQYLNAGRAPRTARNVRTPEESDLKRIIAITFALAFAAPTAPALAHGGWTRTGATGRRPLAGITATRRRMNTKWNGATSCSQA